MVDDRPSNLLLLEHNLRTPGIEIFKADSGQDAVEQAQNNDFALILLDVQMPVMDGFETAEALRKNEKTSHVPIIFITAMSRQDKYVFKGYESGAVDYLFKPVEEAILKSKVKVFTDIYRQKNIIEKQRAELAEKVRELQKALDEIKILKGIIPICANCKKIRNDKGYWQQVESYIEEFADVDFSHGICPDCLRKLYPEVAEEVLREQEEEKERAEQEKKS